MSTKENTVDINTPEGKELLLQFATSIQRIDKQKQLLTDERNDILKRAKEEGFDRVMINKVIKEIREEQGSDRVKDMEKETYYTILKESGIISTVK